ncbi:MAG: hypothetical protein MZU95_17585 [Desulfomicrobium escambiense]|nr:hypothetical protein [Desulfomicrobium escambiense]
MLKFLTSIDDEILKTLRLTTFLNRYAHRNDAERSVFSVNEAVEELVALTARLGRLKRITLGRPNMTKTCHDVQRSGEARASSLLSH